jgi:hypothetical protein
MRAGVVTEAVTKVGKVREGVGEGQKQMMGEG